MNVKATSTYCSASQGYVVLEKAAFVPVVTAQGLRCWGKASRAGFLVIARKTNPFPSVWPWECTKHPRSSMVETKVSKEQGACFDARGN